MVLEEVLFSIVKEGAMSSAVKVAAVTVPVGRFGGEFGERSIPGRSIPRHTQGRLCRFIDSASLGAPHAGSISSTAGSVCRFIA